MTLDGDRFEQAYHSRPTDGGMEEAGRAAHQPESPGHEGFALAGCVLTPEGARRRGYVVVNPDGRIDEIARRRPSSLHVIDTDGVILPGLIDLHGHPEFNVFAPWEPPATFANRYQWRASDIYRRLIREPQNRLLAALPVGTEERYAEIRALVSGVTAIQGASGRDVASEASLVRHVDLPIFGQRRARAMIDLPMPGTPGAEYLKGILAQIASGAVDAFYLHLAEGRRDDAPSIAEFDRLVALGGVTAATIIIHGTALARADFAALADAGAKLVWSPQSNLRLYGETTHASDALDLGLPMALGADWLPSGSLSLLAELKVARRVLQRQDYPITAQELVEMVTSTAAAVAGLDDHLGSLLPGRPADLLVLERRHDDPWRNVIEAEPAWVELVVVNGTMSYGRADWINLADSAAAAAAEMVTAWGKPMLLKASLTQLRAALIAEYPPTGPIFA